VEPLPPPLLELLVVPASSPAPVSQTWKLNKTSVVPPSSVVACALPPPSPLQTPPPAHAFPRSDGAQYGPPRSSQTAHARGVPVPPPEEEPLLLELAPEEDPPLPASTAGYAHPFGSSQQVASMHVALAIPGHACPTSLSGHSWSAQAVFVKARPNVTRRLETSARFMSARLSTHQAMEETP
jgi:hypothetical protein